VKVIARELWVKGKGAKKRRTKECMSSATSLSSRGLSLGCVVLLGSSRLLREDESTWHRWSVVSGEIIRRAFGYLAVSYLENETEMRFTARCSFFFSRFVDKVTAFKMEEATRAFDDGCKSSEANNALICIWLLRDKQSRT
jgi:hypothetical protein